MKQQKDLIIFARWTENMRDLINWGGIGKDIGRYLKLVPLILAYFGSFVT